MKNYRIINSFFRFILLIFAITFLFACADNSDDSNPFANQGYSQGEKDKAPYITSDDNTIFTIGSAESFRVIANGEPTPTIALTGGVLPTGVTFDAKTRRLSGTPAAGTNGTYNLTFTASNEVLPDATQNFTLTVVLPDYPIITSSNKTRFSEGHVKTFTFTATGNPAPTFSITGTLPSGVTFDANTGKLSGTPAAGTTGDYPLVITASNGVLPNATQAFTLKVTLKELVFFGATHYSAHGTSWLYEIDETNGTATLIGDTGYGVTGIAYDEVTGKLYGTTGSGPLIEINMYTGTATAIGTGGVYQIILGTFNSSGSLFAWWDPSQDDLVTIDLTTGIATRVGESGIGTATQGLAFDNNDVLYLVNNGGSVYTLNTATGEGTYVGTVGRTAHHGDFHPETGKYWGLDTRNSSTQNLLVIDIGTFTVENTIPTLGYLHSLAFGWR